ncbi:MAG: leucyl aminopeptidase family protein [Kordiimonadaceae bacterium]|nr:leucyl aminopeptidase family protein [Kordiimonadaceae bacterium]MBO6568772.1 leucyl aminopeptidase family protein [Kordiimonadaceae bacterium]MBO6965252.1 leucyl aminopeptidase family protein [Kordiimonadaceae bacterium]
MPSLASLISSGKPKDDTIALVPVSKKDLEKVLSRLSKTARTWVEANGFDARKNTIAPVPGKGGVIAKILVGTGNKDASAKDPWWLAGTVKLLHPGTYSIDGEWDPAVLAAGAFGWCLAQYKFDRYVKHSATNMKLVGLPRNVVASVKNQVEATTLVRDLVNTPAEHMGPADLQDTAEGLAEKYGGTCCTIVGEDLLEENFPAIHAVGRAAAEGREPRLIDLRWGDEAAPLVTLVGKGVCFDTGGLDIKPSAGMRIMKKDMGGAAHALGLAQLIMASKLKVNLRVLVSAVENSVSANSYRPGDVINTRKGLTVEVGNTDAEGRIVLCDALQLACEENPALLMDFATLTGAARVALGADLPATYCNKSSLWRTLEKSAETTSDPLWRMPLWAPYDSGLSSSIADLGNIADGGFAGSITAALYLQRFVDKSIPWVHYDVYAWNKKTRPGRPPGGEAQGLRASFEAIKSVLKS